MNIAKMINPLIQSVLNQNTEAKPWACPGERRQCGPAMGRSEEAGFRRPVGLRLGRVRGRASPQWAKSALSASLRRFPLAACADSGERSAPVTLAITQDTWLEYTTDEVPRCLPPPAEVSKGYKPCVKGPSDASESERVSPCLRLKGCQQRQSRGPQGSLAGSERQNLRVPSELQQHMGLVSPEIKATKWPGGTSSCPITGLLSNNPQQPLKARLAVHPR